MKKIAIIGTGVILFLLLAGFGGIYIWIDMDVKDHIRIAKEKYPGTAEDALIAYLQDESNSAHERSHIAVWTLGQIHSQKALPVLQELYLNDPEGITCKGKHGSLICQYELHKALTAAESNWWPLHARLNK